MRDTEIPRQEIAQTLRTRYESNLAA